ncbi:hypothetical protein K402DRAFT_180371 [Aulographum hederae CBS 113979]|uniref:Uncharacterized protein n=1 Tax=Aulographum hederae CBS 113979 TaxID=1176131 RepID=A0A6G1GR14_9PEZI|nr:hypothetical protein K402DRAFT_180371 [Aulographum hederae CBS 113979]
MSGGPTRLPQMPGTAETGRIGEVTCRCVGDGYIICTCSAARNGVLCGFFVSGRFLENVSLVKLSCSSDHVRRIPSRFLLLQFCSVPFPRSLSKFTTRQISPDIRPTVKHGVRYKEKMRPDFKTVSIHFSVQFIFKFPESLSYAVSLLPQNFCCCSFLWESYTFPSIISS